MDEVMKAEVQGYIEEGIPADVAKYIVYELDPGYKRDVLKLIGEGMDPKLAIQTVEGTNLRDNR